MWNIVICQLYTDECAVELETSVSQDCGLKKLDSDLGAAAGCCLSALGTKGLFGDTYGGMEGRLRC